MKVTWLSPGDPAQNTGGYRYNARIIAQLEGRDIEVDLIALPGRWPLPGPGELSILGQLLSAIPDGEIVVADGLCWPGLGEIGEQLARRCKVIVIVHSLLARETGLSPEESKALLAMEVASWGPVRQLVATSRKTANEIAARSSAPTLVSIPGTDPAVRPQTPTPRNSIPPAPRAARLLTVATIVPRKGHDLLLAALSQVKAPWELRCVGGVRDALWGKRMRDLAQQAGLDSRVRWLGDLPFASVCAELDQADLVLQPARYEAFGMAIAEAISRGRPVLTAPAGIIEHLPDGAAQIVDGDASVWSAAIQWFLTDHSARRTLAERAAAASGALPTWEEQADEWILLLASL